MNLDLSYYWAVFLRRIHYFILVSTLVSAVALALAYLLPPTYQASTNLIVESSQIPQGMAAPTVQTAALEQLQIIESRLMTRQNLLDIAQRTRALGDTSAMQPDDVVQAMRAATRINPSAGRGQATMMSISFEAETAEATAAVLNEYLTIILRDNLQIRTERATQTLEFFEQEVQRLGAELDAQSAKLIDFQNANADALPNTLQFRLNQQTMLQGTIASADSNIQSLEDQKEQLIAVFNATGTIGNAPGVQKTPAEQQLDNARDQLNQALAIYSPTNPKVKILEARVAQLEEVVRAQLPATTGTVSPAASMLDVQIASIDARIKSELDKKTQAETQLADVTSSIDRTAQNQIALDALNRDYANIQQQYNTAVTRLSQAATGERIEVLSKGERITVIDAPSVPSKPFRPNRLLIGAGGVMSGIALGIAVVVLIELLNRSVRRPKDLINAFGITPLTTIPYIRTPGEAMLRRAAFLGMLAVTVIGIPAILYAVHIYYQPLDLVLSRIASKFGITL